MSYEEHIARKGIVVPLAGFDVIEDRPWLYPFQRDTVAWALKLGRSAIFADTGLGKTRMQLAWASRVVERLRTEGRSPTVLLLAPLAVGAQTVREAERVGLTDVRLVRSQDDVSDGINVVNYDVLHKFDLPAFGGVVLDESSILKSYTGTTKRALVEGCKDVPYRLACTATPAPNDHLELGNHAEFLGVMSSHQMIARWFISDQSEMGTYQLKGHAVRPFWDWVASWARCIGVPSDIGPYSDAGYVLPRLDVQIHHVAVDIVDGRADGALFREIELSATSIHREKRRTASERARRVAELVSAEPGEAWLVWCETNYEAEALTAVLPGAVEVSGDQTPEVKADRLLGFAERGGILITKPKIAGFGMNWQNCARIAFVGGSYSYEAFYQAVRRCWRFGQPREVVCHVVMATTEAAMWRVVHGKSEAHGEMKQSMFAASRRAAARAAATIDYHPTHIAPLPKWLESRP